MTTNLSNFAAPIRLMLTLASGPIFSCCLIPSLAAQQIPHLEHQHGTSQIVVDGKPFLVHGGELENSSASSVAYLDSFIWPEVPAMHFNTVLSPVYWELIEPTQVKITQKSNYAVRR
jgi:hypothetical protein